MVDWYKINPFIRRLFFHHASFSFLIFLFPLFDLFSIAILLRLIPLGCSLLQKDLVKRCLVTLKQTKKMHRLMLNIHKTSVFSSHASLACLFFFFF